jgi:hypothetical protein
MFCICGAEVIRGEMLCRSCENEPGNVDAQSLLSEIRFQESRRENAKAKSKRRSLKR